MNMEKLQLPSIPGSNVIPAFLIKLRSLLDDSENEHLICWDESGTSFHLIDQTIFAKEILPKYFKHNNLASFVRQLNMYGFKKVATIEHGGLTSRDDMEFENPNFRKDDYSLMGLIKRKNARNERTLSGSSIIRDKLSEYTALQPAQVTNVLVDVRELKKEQDSMNGQLSLLKRENSAMWSQITKLRQKHEQQQMIINKLIQFMMTMAQGRSKLKRTLPMIELEPSKKAKPAASNYQVSSYSDSITNPLQSHMLSNSGHSVGSSTGNTGITIKDITDDDNLDNFEPDETLSNSTEFNLPATLINVESPRPTEQPVSTAMISLPTNSSIDNPKIFATQFSDSVQDVQSDIDILRDLFTISDSLGVSNDTLDNLFDGSNDKIYYNSGDLPSINLMDLIQNADSATVVPSLQHSSNQTPFTVDGAISTLEEHEFDGLMKEISSGAGDGALDNQDLNELLQPLVSDDEGDADKPIISSLDLD